MRGEEGGGGSLIIEHMQTKKYLTKGATIGAERRAIRVSLRGTWCVLSRDTITIFRATRSADRVTRAFSPFARGGPRGGAVSKLRKTMNEDLRDGWKIATRLPPIIRRFE